MKEMLVEHFYIPQIKNMEESSGDGKWKAPIWNLDKLNLNGRIYPRELAERICAEQLCTIANDGHEKDWKTGSEYGEAVAICKNPRIEGNQLWVDIEFIDEEYRKKIEIIKSNGVRIGVSSVGYGECDSDGRVIPETYELVRYLDFVLNPAGCVFATNQEESQKHDDKRKEEMSSSFAEAMAERKRVLSGRLSKLYFGGEKHDC